MNRRLAAVAAMVVVLLGVPLAVAGDSNDRVYVEAEQGDGYWSIARRLAPGCTQAQIDAFAQRLQARNSMKALFPGSFVDYLEGDVPACMTATTLPATTTSTVDTTVDTIPVDTTAATTTTVAPPTVPQMEPPGEGFFEDFTGDATLSGFRTGVFHRDDDTQGGSTGSETWPGDHADLGAGDCGQPTSIRTVREHDRSEAVYLCTGVDGDTSKAHLMSSMGHVDSYSIVWFSPDRTFNEADTVSWDVNVTDLGGRQWWEVMIVPAGSPDATCVSWLPCDLPSYPADAVVVSTRDLKTRIVADGTERDPTWQPICRTDWALDPEGCASKAIRRSWSVTDNHDGTITVGFLDNTWTVPGAFPQGEWKVVFKTHAYTPLKDGPVAGHTWHWDRISVD